jgi:DNA-binding protein Fis
LENEFLREKGLDASRASHVLGAFFHLHTRRVHIAGMLLAEMEQFLIVNALTRNNNRAAAVRQLGINAGTLFRKLKSLLIGDNSAK